MLSFSTASTIIYKQSEVILIPNSLCDIFLLLWFFFLFFYKWKIVSFVSSVLKFHDDQLWFDSVFWFFFFLIFFLFDSVLIHCIGPFQSGNQVLGNFSELLFKVWICNSKFKIIIFYWSIVDIQCYVNFCYTERWFSCIYTHSLFLYLLFLYGWSWDIDYNPCAIQ